MKKKIITSLIAAAILVSGNAAFAAESDIMLIGESDVPTEIVVTDDIAATPEVVTSKYTRLEAEAVKVEEETLTVKNEEETSVKINENTVVLNSKGEVKKSSDIKEGDKLYIYTVDEAAAVIVIMDNAEDEMVNVDVDTYVKSDSFGVVVNATNTLALNLDETSDITDLNGEKVDASDLENKNLAVFYDIVAMSIPGQTTPLKVVVLGEEVVEETEETPSTPEVVAPEYTKTAAEVVNAEENSLTIQAEDETPVNVAEAPIVFDSNGEVKKVSDIKTGDKLYIFTKDDSASVIVILDAETEVNVDLSKYAKSEDALVNAENTLALNLSEESVIKDLNGEKVDASDLSDKYLAVFYTISTRSIPAQTTPEKVVVIGDASEEIPVVADPMAVTKVTANGNEICEVKYDNDSKTFMVPVRAIAETLGYTVGWEGGELRVTVGNETVNVDFKIGVNEYTLTGSEAKALEKAPELINDTTFIPCSLFSEVLGNKVEINGDTLAITVE